MDKQLTSFSNLVDALSKLPSIGKKSALKMAYTLCIDDIALGLNIAESINEAVRSTSKCSICGGLSEGEICHICIDSLRSNGKLCIVSHPKDILLIEGLKEFFGRYCVLESIKDFDFESLIKRINEEKIEEIIFAFSPSLSSDVLITHLQDKLSHLNLKFTRIAQGVPSNVNLDNIDHFSLSKAFMYRVDL
ncbi:recombination protein RecR [Helicobacter sp. 13S00401-1]|uniref:recombination mediator RecR n=1 Tax=Helicobacter sp. 13S00401-1 TaxID=1905758 RepID=UPI000BA53D8B|nr:recombination mediator RecR [Helicobacter sp. 13S00401-1]PAF49354.1 recombination protein RecR [Helicobacter sp. 13S00401-1]